MKKIASFQQKFWLPWFNEAVPLLKMKISSVENHFREILAGEIPDASGDPCLLHAPGQILLQFAEQNLIRSRDNIILANEGWLFMYCMDAIEH